MSGSHAPQLRIALTSADSHSCDGGQLSREGDRIRPCRSAAGTCAFLDCGHFVREAIAARTCAGRTFRAPRRCRETRGCSRGTASGTTRGTARTCELRRRKGQNGESKESMKQGCGYLANAPGCLSHTQPTAAAARHNAKRTGDGSGAATCYWKPQETEKRARPAPCASPRARQCYGWPS